MPQVRFRDYAAAVVWFNHLLEISDVTPTGLHLSVRGDGSTFVRDIADPYTHRLLWQVGEETEDGLLWELDEEGYEAQSVLLVAQVAAYVARRGFRPVGIDAGWITFEKRLPRPILTIEDVVENLKELLPLSDHTRLVYRWVGEGFEPHVYNTPEDHSSTRRIELVYPPSVNMAEVATFLAANDYELSVSAVVEPPTDGSRHLHLAFDYTSEDD